MSTYNEYMAAANKAHKANDTEAARKLVQLAQQAKTAEEPAGFLAGSGEAIAEGATSVGQAAVGAYQNFAEGRDDMAAGIESGIGSIYDGGRNLYADMTGNEELNADVEASQAAREAEMAPVKERSPYATGAGEIVGEGIALLPATAAGAAVLPALGTTATAVGLGTGLKTLAGHFPKMYQGGRSVIAGLGSGATEGLVQSDGTLVERGADVGLSSAVSGVFGPAGDMLSGFLTGKARRAAAKDDIVGDVAGLSPEAQQLKEATGVEMPSAIMTDDTAGRIQLGSAIEDETSDAGIEVSDIMKKKYSDLQAKAQSLTGGNTANLDEAGTIAAKEVANARQADNAAVSEAYATLDKMVAEGNMRMPRSAGLSSELDAHLAGPDGVAAPKEFASDIQRILTANKMSGAGTDAPTMGDYEKVRSQINGLWTDNLNNNSKRLIASTNELIDKHLDQSLSGLSGAGKDIYAQAVTAREAYKAALGVWGPKETATKLANNFDPNYKGPEIKAISVVKRLLTDTSGIELTSMRRALKSQGERGQLALDSIEAAPINEAITHATSTGTFDPQAFAKKIKDTVKGGEGKEHWEALWGPERAAEMKAVVEAFELMPKSNVSAQAANSVLASVVTGAGAAAGGSVTGRGIRAGGAIGRQAMSRRAQRKESEAVLEALKAGEISPAQQEKFILESIERLFGTYDPRALSSLFSKEAIPATLGRQQAAQYGNEEE